MEIRINMNITRMVTMFLAKKCKILVKKEG